MKNLILIGFMGAGKTTAGRLLAKKKEMQFIDTDERIEWEQGMSIPDLFRQYGEEHFRDLETALLKELRADTKNAVISVGGGMPVREENRKLLRSLGCVIYLSASKETILERVQGGNSRPMLDGSDLEETVERLMREREALYRRTAHLTVRTDQRSVHQVARIMEQETRKFS